MRNQGRHSGRGWGRQLAFAIVTAALLSGCQTGPSADDVSRLHQQAQAALARWADAVSAAGGQPQVVLVGELTGQIGDWELAVGDNNKRALMAGMVAASSALPDAPPPPGEVRFQDGTTVTVPLLPALDALVTIGANTSGPCTDCAMLLVTAARLTSAPIQTTRGPATAPVWEFTVQGTAVKVTRVAIANPVTVAPPPDSGDAQIGIVIDSASGSVSGRELTVAFVGSPRPGDQPCGEDYTGEAVESDLAVVPIVYRHPHVTLGGCTAEGARRTAQIELGAPLGNRAVLDVQRGLPVTVVLTP